MTSIKQSIEKLTKNGNTEVESFLGKVTKVNETNRVCDVLPLDGAELFDVKLSAAGKGDTGVWVIPKKGSFVIVTMLGNNAGFVSLASEVKKTIVEIDGTSLEIEKGTIEINSGLVGKVVVNQTGVNINAASTPAVKGLELSTWLVSLLVVLQTARTVTQMPLSPDTIAALAALQGTLPTVLSQTTKLS